MARIETPTIAPHPALMSDLERHRHEIFRDLKVARKRGSDFMELEAQVACDAGFIRAIKESVEEPSDEVRKRELVAWAHLRRAAYLGELPPLTVTA